MYEGEGGGQEHGQVGGGNESGDAHRAVQPEPAGLGVELFGTPPARAGDDQGDVGAAGSEGSEGPQGGDQVLAPGDGAHEQEEAAGPDAVAGADRGHVHLAHRAAKDGVDALGNHGDPRGVDVGGVGHVDGHRA